MTPGLFLRQAAMAATALLCLALDADQGVVVSPRITVESQPDYTDLRRFAGFFKDRGLQGQALLQHRLRALVLRVVALDDPDQHPRLLAVRHRALRVHLRRPPQQVPALLVGVLLEHVHAELEEGGRVL